MIWDTWDLQKLSNYLWWALFFFGYLLFGLIYILLHLPYPVSSVGLEWLLWVGGVLLAAFFITLPLLIYKHPVRATWGTFAALLVFYVSFISYELFILETEGEELGYLILFLMGSFIYGFPPFVAGFLFPLFLQKKFTIKGLGFDIAVILLWVEVFTVVSSTVLLATIFL